MVGFVRRCNFSASCLYQLIILSCSCNVFMTISRIRVLYCLRILGVMYDHTLFSTCKSPDQT